MIPRQPDFFRIFPRLTMRLNLIRLLFLGVALFPVESVAAGDLIRRDRKDPPTADSEKKDDKKDDSAKSAFEVDAVKDIAYRSDSLADPKLHRLDLYVPKGVKSYPVLFFVHGGAWRSGDKSEYEEFGKTFAGLGIGTVIINYRLSPKVQHPAHIEDVASAFAWTHANIAKYGGRPDRIFACGHSAGGHLVALLATDDKYVKKEHLALSDIHGVIAISGVHHIMPIVPICRTAFGSDREECKNASPINHVAKSDPPFLLLYGDKDLPTLGRMAEDMDAELKKNKCDSECLKMAHRTHMTIITSMVDDKDETRLAVLQFVADHSEWKSTAVADNKDDKRREGRRRDAKREDK
jgi:acetyl esterase/lipase